MPARPLVILPDPLLRRRSEPVEAVDDGIRALLDDMLATMYAAPGIGLAAIQVGVPKRLVTIDLSKDEAARRPMFFVNPQIVWASEERSTYEEGCLSIPDYFEEVERPAQVRVSFLDREGRPQEIEADGLLATCIQHEIDHLDGILFIDRLSKLKRDRIIRRFSKQARQAEREAKPAVRLAEGRSRVRGAASEPSPPS